MTSLRMNYAKLFFFGIKSPSMKRIEKDSPNLSGFGRARSFFFAFGNIGFDFKKGFLIILPAICRFEYSHNDNVLHITTPLFSYYGYKKRKNNESSNSWN